MRPRIARFFSPGPLPHNLRQLYQPPYELPIFAALAHSHNKRTQAAVRQRRAR